MMRAALRAARRLLADRAGNFATMTAVVMPVLIGAAAFSVDIGSLYLERRQLQSLADLAAISAAANLHNPQQVALATLRDNGLSQVQLVSWRTGPDETESLPFPHAIVVPGTYVADAAMAQEERFTAAGPQPNATTVIVRAKGTRHFSAAFIPAPTIEVRGVAATSAQAGFSVGARLLGLDGGILNALLGSLIGGNVSLRAMDYEALLATDVKLLDFLDALALDLGLTAGTYDELLDTRVGIGRILRALAKVSGHNRDAQLALSALADTASLGAGIGLQLSSLVDLGDLGRLGINQRASGFDAGIGLMEIVGASAALANGSNQIALGAGLDLPGLAGVSLDLAIGEPAQHSAWFALGPAGTIVRTAQTRLKLEATVGGAARDLGSGISLLAVRLPVHVEVGHAEARATDLTCRNGQPTVTIAARPGVASLRIAESQASGFADFSRPQSFSPATIADVSLRLLIIRLDLLAIRAEAHVAVDEIQPRRLIFDRADIDGKVVKSVSTRDATRSLVSSLLEDLRLSANVAGLGIDVTWLLGIVRPALMAILTAVAEPVDTLLYNVLAMLGIKIGEADIRVHDAQCGRSVLVQ